MRYLNALPRALLHLPVVVGLCISVSAIIVSLYSFLVVPWIHENPVIFVIPISLSAWMFRKIGLFCCFSCLLIPVWIADAIHYHNFLLPMNIALYFVVSGISLFIAGFFVYSQRDAFDLADRAQRELGRAYYQQQRLNEIKDQFLQNVNHELRTPLTAIYGYLELLLEHNEQLDNKIRSTFLEHAMQSCDELQLLVNNVLDTMGIESEKKHIYVEELAVIDIISEVLERFDPKTLQSHRIVIDVPEYIRVLANAQYTRQILRNLLSNAFKYVPAQTTITLSARLYGDVVAPFHPSPEIEISVQDEGPGIPKDEQGLLFGQFVRLRRDTNGPVRGSGLGLYLSRQFVSLMDGRIWLESEGIPGKGCKFSFTLPCIPIPSVPAKTTKAMLDPLYSIALPTDD
ncbi:sensor histidine kinase [Tengunoibacter tsumagoiensis]|uniref:histidine kinase n=1 Tax=Tengunoibacter tsumagoiensis TaxID=2014871 RepID=A0A401ZU73_9CHLR|nr:HAMP domain-containing sensor histidine kinase [Tengunoibacter tsumagoiensis]GCE10455.1 hypothetical protein KTT_03140 [Tengunoibacter tsumagoiensis]